MGKINKPNNIGGIIGTVCSVVSVATPLVDKAIDMKKEQEAMEKEVTIPALYSKNFPLEIQQAVKLIESCELKAVPVRLTIKEADAKYKDYFDGQVIASNPKQNKIVKVGSIVYLKYITQEVIDKSQEIFKDSERIRIERQEKKQSRRIERNKLIKKGVSGIIDKMKTKLEEQKE